MNLNISLEELVAVGCMASASTACPCQLIGPAIASNRVGCLCTVLTCKLNLWMPSAT
jgi:hypothetical protein